MRERETTKSRAAVDGALPLVISLLLTFAGSVGLEDLLGLPAGLRLLLDREQEVAAGRGGGADRSLIFVFDKGFVLPSIKWVRACNVAVFFEAKALRFESTLDSQG